MASTLKMDPKGQKDFLEVLKMQIEANLACHESTPGPAAMSKQDEFNFGQFNIIRENWQLETRERKIAHFCPFFRSEFVK